MSARKKRQSTTKCTVLEDDSKTLEVKFVDDDDIETVLYGLNSESEEVLKPRKGKSDKLVNKTPSKGSKKQKTKNVPEELEESETEHDDEVCEKPSGLCEEDDIAGEEMYSFRTPKKNQGMLIKARESVSKSQSKNKSHKKSVSKNIVPVQSLTPSRKTPVSKLTASSRSEKKTSGSSKTSEIEPPTIPKTPYGLRARYKKDIQYVKRQFEVEENWSDSDYNSSEGSSSESSDESDEETKEDSSSDSGKGSEQSRPKCRRSLIPVAPPTTPSTRKKRKDLEYVVEAEEYFQSHGTKCRTSDNNLSRLRTPRLDSNELHKLLTQHSVSKEHQRILTARRSKDSLMFQRWMLALSEGFSVLAYGLGSKYKILQNFHREMLSDSHVLVVNGFFPSLSIKEIVEMVAQDLLGLRHTLPSPHAVVDWIESRRNAPRVFLIVHSLDAQMLRCEKTQQLFSRLASLPRVHLVASVDHINCPLLWDQSKLGNFNFMWEDVTSFLPYQEETSYENSLMVQNSGNLVLSSLLNVYRSLPNNSRGVFRLILDKHLDNNNQKSNGMAFSELYSRCREEMLVTSDLALRTMLTEFLDHQMVKWRKDQEHLYIPTDTGVLRQFQQILQEES